MSFGRNLAAVRKEKGLTQETLVQKSGVAISQIRRYEADKSSPTLDVLIRLARALGVSLDELAFDQGSGVAASKILDRELLEQFEAVSRLDEEERTAVKKLLEGMIVKHQVEKLMKLKVEQSWAQRFRAITEKLAQGAKGLKQAQIDQVIDEAVAAVRVKRHVRS
jgi:transcriptional regulator with XRE-family HTH domain